MGKKHKSSKVEKMKRQERWGERQERWESNRRKKKDKTERLATRPKQ